MFPQVLQQFCETLILSSTGLFQQSKECANVNCLNRLATIGLAFTQCNFKIN